MNLFFDKVLAESEYQFFPLCEFFLSYKKEPEEEIEEIPVLGDTESMFLEILKRTNDPSEKESNKKIRN